MRQIKDKESPSACSYTPFDESKLPQYSLFFKTRGSQK